MAPILHAKNSAKKYGGKPEDYIDIHEFMDLSKASFGDARHRLATHNSFFCVQVIPKIFGHERTNSEGSTYIPKDIAEQHCIEDMGFVPSIQDFAENMKLTKWMKGNSTVKKPIVNYQEKKVVKQTKVIERDPMRIRYD